MANLNSTDNRLNFTKEFGPYSEMPLAYISYDHENSGLFRIIVEESEETKKPEKINFWKGVLYFLFLYNPPKDGDFKTERKIVEEEKLADDVNNFQIEERNKRYYIKTW